MMLGARVVCSAFLFLASAQAEATQTGTSSSVQPSSSSCQEVCVVEPCNACSETGIMSILPIFVSGTVLSTGTGVQSQSQKPPVFSSQGPTEVSILPITASVSVLPTTVSGEMSIPAGETPLLPTRPGPPAFNGTLSTSPTPTATVTTTSTGGSQTSGTSRSSGAPNSSAPANSSASRFQGQSAVMATVMAAVGFTWALL